MELTPRQRVERALRGGHSDSVPFTMYECMIPQCAAEREMRNRGLCIVQRDVPVFETHRPNVRITEHTYVISMPTAGCFPGPSLRPNWTISKPLPRPRTRI